jgi:hypothetical protein
MLIKILKPVTGTGNDLTEKMTQTLRSVLSTRLAPTQLTFYFTEILFNSGTAPVLLFNAELDQILDSNKSFHLLRIQFLVGGHSQVPVAVLNDENIQFFTF